LSNCSEVEGGGVSVCCQSSALCPVKTVDGVGDSVWVSSCQPGGHIRSLLMQGDGGSWWSALRRGWLSQLQLGKEHTRKAMEEALWSLPMCREWHISSSMGTRQVPRRLGGTAWLLPAVTSFLADDSTATCSNSQIPVSRVLLLRVANRMGAVWGSESIGINGCHRGRC
jgi:hypothetical protein